MLSVSIEASTKFLEAPLILHGQSSAIESQDRDVAGVSSPLQDSGLNLRAVLNATFRHHEWRRQFTLMA